MATKRAAGSGIGDYEPPNPPDLTDETDSLGRGQEFISPDEGNPLASDAADVDVNAFLETVDSQILGAKAEVEALL